MRGHALIAVLLVAAASVRIVVNCMPLSQTVDEPIHFGAGMEWLWAGSYDWDASHPPLARITPAILASLAGARYAPDTNSIDASMKIWGSGAHYDRMLATARAGILPMFWLACAVLFLWARRIAGGAAGVAAVAVFTTIPPVLAHAGLITTDMAATAFTAAGACVAPLWAERPTRARTALFGATLGLCALAKFSVPVFLTVIWLLWLLWKRPSLAAIRARIIPAVAALAIGCVVLWAGYRFSLDGFLPAPRFWTGLGMLLKHNQDGHASYILGHRHQLGVWYFFPVTLLVKTPLALLALLALAVWKRPRGIAAPVLYCAAIMLIAMSSHINIGVRHVLPIYVGLSLIAGVLAAQLWKTRARYVVAALFAWQAISGVIAQPDLISYTNEITRGRPEEWVAESDLDWGQDMHRVAAFLNAHGAREVSFRPYCVDYVKGGHPMPRLTPSDWYHSEPGWNVVSLSGLKVFDHPGWIKFPPQYRIGRTHWAWYFPPGAPVHLAVP
jgi:hypothetical protein